MKNLFNIVIGATNLLAFIVLTGFFAGRGMKVDQSWNTVDVLTIVLSALALIITILGVILAIAALWGFSQIRDAAIKGALEKAEGVAETAAKAKISDMVPGLVSQEVNRMIGGQTAEDGYGPAGAERSENA